MKMFSALLIVSLGGCVRTSLVVVDKKTALEAEAAGSYPKLEEELTQAALVPHGEPLTNSDLRAAGKGGGEIAESAIRDLSRAGEVDELLVRACIGEGQEGLLVETAERCQGAFDELRLSRLVERENRNRVQVWHFLFEEATKSGRAPVLSALDVQRVWQKNHLLGVVCGAEVQAADGSWSAKKC